MSLGGQPQIFFRVVKAGDELKLGNGLSGKVGGHLRVQLSLMVAPNTRVNPNVRTVTVRLKEEPDDANSVEHPEAENHVDVTFGLDGYWLKWRARYVPGGQTPPPPVLMGWGNPMEVNSDPQHAYIYTATFGWNSTGVNGYDTIFGYYWDWNNWDESYWEEWYWEEWYWGYWMWGYWGWGWNVGDTKLLGHNGKHTLSMVKIGYAGGGVVQEQETDDFPFQTFNPFGGAWSDVAVSPGQKQYDVQNLVITDVKTNVNEDYFIYDPDSEVSSRKQPKIEFTIKDDGDPHRYKCKIYIRPTWQPYDPAISFPNAAYAYLEGEKAEPGTVSVLWNGGRSNNNLEEWDRAEAGTYAFDVYVDEVEVRENSTLIHDHSHLKSPYSLKLTDHYVQVNDNLEEDRKIEVGFQISDVKNKDATAMEANVLDTEMNVKKVSELPTFVDVAHESISVYKLGGSEDGIGWRVIFTGEDSHKNDMRNHKNKRMIAVNKLVPGRVAWIIDTDRPETLNIDTKHVELAFADPKPAISRTGIRVYSYRIALDSNRNTKPKLVAWLDKNGYSRTAVIYEKSDGTSNHLAGFTETNRDGSNATPRRSRYSQEIISNKPWVDANNVRIVTSNAALHELGHALGIGGQGNFGPDRPDRGDHVHTTPFCVMGSPLTPAFEATNPKTIFGRLSIRTLHVKAHINEMRVFCDLDQLP